jgi:hypothetical protein
MTFPQRQIAQRDRVGPDPAQDLVEEHRAGDDEVGAPRFEPRHPQALLDIHRDEILAQPVNLLGRNAAVAKRDADVPVRGQRDSADAQDGSRRADDALETRFGDLIEVLADLLFDVAHHATFVARFERVALDEPFGQPDHAEFEAPGEFRACRIAARHLDAAAADVDHDRDRRRARLGSFVVGP